MAIEANPLAVNGQPFLGRQPERIRILLVQIAQGRNFGRRIPWRISEETPAKPDAPVDRMSIFSVTVPEQESRLGQNSAPPLDCGNPRKAVPARRERRPVILGQHVVDHHEFG